MKNYTVERRRGKALEDAVLDAAWSELADGGYASFTMEAVAARAHTSRPVLRYGTSCIHTLYMPLTQEICAAT
jgi:AcrR family transcriptional regulator